MVCLAGRLQVRQCLSYLKRYEVEVKPSPQNIYSAVSILRVPTVQAYVPSYAVIKVVTNIDAEFSGSA